MKTIALAHSWTLLALMMNTVNPPVSANPAPKLPNGEPILRMPFPAGTVVLCLQGNQSPPGYSHSTPTCLHAIDFSNPTGEADQIVAAADGVVAYALSDVDPDDMLAGSGFGNHVKIDHGDGYFTLYAHFESVKVSEGDRVKTGDPLGTMGQTGNTKVPHLHFSLHRGNPKAGLPPTVPIHALIAADMTLSTEFNLFTSLELIPEAGKDATEGHLYGSENKSDQKPLSGAAPNALAAKLQKAAEQLRKAKGKAPAETLWVHDIVQKMNANGPRWAHDKLQQIVAAKPDEMEAWYWIGVTAHTSLQKNKVATRAFNKIIEAKPKTPTWLLPWAHLRIGMIAESENRPNDAIAAFEKSVSFREDGSGFEKVARDKLKKLQKN